MSEKKLYTQEDFIEHFIVPGAIALREACIKSLADKLNISIEEARIMWYYPPRTFTVHPCA